MRLSSLFFQASKQQSEKSDGGGTIGTVKRFKRIWKDYGYLSDEVREITNTSKHLSQDQREELRYKRYEGLLSKPSLLNLKSVPAQKKYDSRFIRETLKGLYTNESIGDRTLFGSGGSRKMSPGKVDAVRKLMDERTATADDKEERVDAQYINNKITSQLTYLKSRAVK